MAEHKYQNIDGKFIEYENLKLLKTNRDIKKLKEKEPFRILMSIRKEEIFGGYCFEKRSSHSITALNSTLDKKDIYEMVYFFNQGSFKLLNSKIIKEPFFEEDKFDSNYYKYKTFLEDLNLLKQN